MGRNKKFRPGDPVGSLPTQTWNRMAGKVDQLHLALATEEDLRKPKVKSPVHVQIVWCSDTDCDPGNVVNIRGAASDLSEDDGAPFAGLLLLATEFIEGEASDAYAITMGPIDGGESWDATLTTRTNDSEGVLTMPDGSHGIEEESTFILIWEDGSRVGVVAGSVSDDSVPFEGGYGDDLPDADTEIRVTREASTGFAVLPEAYWAKVDFSAADQTTAGLPTSGTVLSGGGSIKVIWKEPGTGEKWAVIQLAGSGGTTESGGSFGIVKHVGGCAYLVSDGGDNYAWVKSAHALGDTYGISLPTGKVVFISGSITWTEYATEEEAIESEPDCPFEGPLAFLINAVDQLYQAPGFGAAKGLYSEGAGPDAIEWGGDECVPEE